MLHTDFIEKLEEYDLVYRYTLRLDSTVNDLLRRVIDDMAASPSSFTFPIARRASTAASTAITAVQLLGLVDRGRPHKTLGVHLRVEPHTLDMTIEDLAYDPNHFAGRNSIRDGQFIIRLGMSLSCSLLLSSLLFPLAVMGETLLGRRGGRRHGCISTHIYSLFPLDGNSMAEDNNATSGGESEDEEQEVRRLLWASTYLFLLKPQSSHLCLFSL
jgi:hypothetical protein